MLKKLLPIFLILGLTSCDTGPREGSDGYKFGQPQYERSQVQINVVTYKNRNYLLAAAKARGVDNTDVVAFSVLRPPFDTCTIHMIDPRVSYEPEFVGHEYLHCVYGQWHTNNDSKS